MHRSSKEKYDTIGTTTDRIKRKGNVRMMENWSGNEMMSDKMENDVTTCDWNADFAHEPRSQEGMHQGLVLRGQRSADIRVEDENDTSERLWIRNERTKIRRRTSLRMMITIHTHDPWIRTEWALVVRMDVSDGWMNILIWSNARGGLRVRNVMLETGCWIRDDYLMLLLMRRTIEYNNRGSKRHTGNIVHSNLAHWKVTRIDQKTTNP